MNICNINENTGFSVIYNSSGWRIAQHVYEKEVNGIEAFRLWGRHMSSDEAFLLLSGKGWIVTSTDGKAYNIASLKKDQMLVVNKGERHCIILTEGSSTLIAENQDMSDSVSEEIDTELKNRIIEIIRKDEVR